MAWLTVMVLVIGVPLPEAPWSVGPDGKSCVQLAESLMAEFAAWEEDPENTVLEEGIYGRVNPKDRRQLVLLFGSREACESILWAMGEERRDDAPENRLDEKQVEERIGAAVKTAALVRSWAKLGSKEQKTIYREAKALFVGDASRKKARRQLWSIATRVRKAKRKQRGDEVRLELFSQLFVTVFGEEPELSETER